MSWSKVDLLAARLGFAAFKAVDERSRYSDSGTGRPVYPRTASCIAAADRCPDPPGIGLPCCGSFQPHQCTPFLQTPVECRQIALAQLVGFAAAQHQGLQVGSGDGAAAGSAARQRADGQLLGVGQRVQLVQRQPAIGSDRPVKLHRPAEFCARQKPGRAGLLRRSAGPDWSREWIALLNGLDRDDGIRGTAMP